MMGEGAEPGIIPQAIDEIFAHIENAQNMEFLLRVSCMEIYNETISVSHTSPPSSCTAISSCRPLFLPWGSVHFPGVVFREDTYRTILQRLFNCVFLSGHLTTILQMVVKLTNCAK